jgi:hypothetical protein
VNTEEQQLTEMLHRMTPEPPRRVTVDDIAIRLASQAGPGRQPRYRRRPDREPRRRRPNWGRAWAPVLAAASVFVVAGAAAGIAMLANSHHSPQPQGQGTQGATSAGPASSSPAGATTPATPAGPGTAIANAPWGAALVNHQALIQGSLTGSGDSLYAFTGQDLVRIDPATGATVRSVPFSPAVTSPPVILGSTVWVVSSYGGGAAVLRGYDAQSLDLVRSVTVLALGQVSGAAQGVLAAGPDGYLYVAAGDSVAVVNPADGALVRRILQPSGPVSSVAVSPDGTRLYLSTSASPGQGFRLLTYRLTDHVQAGASGAPAGAGGNLVATDGGVWGTLGTGQSESVWFARGGDLSPASPVIHAASGGFEAMPGLAGGAVWIGGTNALACADPATGSVRASATIPADQGVAQYIGSVTYAGGRAYAYYIDPRSQTQGVVILEPPAACVR